MKVLANIRHINAVLSVALLVLFVLHGVFNSLQLTDLATVIVHGLTDVLFAVACLHAVLGVILTVVTLRAQGDAGASYPGSNKRFWAVRISGLCVAVFVVLHVMAFAPSGGDIVRLRVFEELQLVTMLLMVASLAVHVLANMQPLLISLGVPGAKSRAADLAIALAVILAIFAVAFIVYYLRWNIW